MKQYPETAEIRDLVGQLWDRIKKFEHTVDSNNSLTKEERETAHDVIDSARRKIATLPYVFLFPPRE